jgi:hypothetical protein
MVHQTEYEAADPAGSLITLVNYHRVDSADPIVGMQGGPQSREAFWFEKYIVVHETDYRLRARTNSLIALARRAG